MNYIYLLKHFDEKIPESEDEGYYIKTLGYFENSFDVKEAIKRYRLLPGFKSCSKVYYESDDIDAKPGFHIYKSFIDKSYWQGGFVSWEEALKELHEKEGTQFEIEENDALEIFLRLFNIPLWLKDKISKISIFDLSEIFAEKYTKNNYPKGLGSEFNIVFQYIKS